MRRRSRRYRDALPAAALVLVTSLTGCGATGGGSPFCQALDEQLPAYTDDPLKALPPGAGASAWRAHFTLMRQRTVKLSEVAPAELREATTRLEETNDKLAEMFRAAQHDPAQVDPGLVTQLLRDTGYPEAVATVTAYRKNSC